MNRKLLSLCFLVSFSFFASLLTGEVRAQSKVNTHEGVEIGGIKQWIGVKGDDSSKPLLLFLHGGPGFSSRTYSKKFVKALKKDFLVAQWDQRESGITKAWNSDESTITLERMHKDTEEVVKRLLKKFKKEKLYLVGYSWGGFLGFELASKHPGYLHAYIAVNPLIHGNKSDEITKTYLLEEARKLENQTAINELQALTVASNSWEELRTLRKWTSTLIDGTNGDTAQPESLYREWASTWLAVFQEASKVNFILNEPELHCPVYFFTSKKDYVANFELVTQYYNTLKAPHKELIWFPEAGHEIPSKQPKAFAKALINLSNSSN